MVWNTTSFLTVNAYIHWSYLSMVKTILIFIISAFALGDSGLQQKTLVNPYDILTYDRVVAYDYDGMSNHRIVKDGQLIKFDGRHGKIFNQIELTKNQIARFHKIIGDTATYGGYTAACFDPHMGVVYYLRDKIVGHISICVDCNYLEPSLEIPASEFKKYYIGEGDDRYEAGLRGFSLPARKKILAFCEELKFSNCDDNYENIKFLFGKN
jgi:hypothetical protein